MLRNDKSDSLVTGPKSRRAPSNPVYAALPLLQTSEKASRTLVLQDAFLPKNTLKRVSPFISRFLMPRKFFTERSETRDTHINGYLTLPHQLVQHIRQNPPHCDPSASEYNQYARALCDGVLFPCTHRSAGVELEGRKQTKDCLCPPRSSIPACRYAHSPLVSGERRGQFGGLVEG